MENFLYKKMKLLAASSYELSVGLYWVVHRPDGSFMDPTSGKDSRNFEELIRFAKEVSISNESIMSYPDTGASIVFGK